MNSSRSLFLESLNTEAIDLRKSLAAISSFWTLSWTRLYACSPLGRGEGSGNRAAFPSSLKQAGSAETQRDSRGRILPLGLPGDLELQKSERGAPRPSEPGRAVGPHRGSGPGQDGDAQERVASPRFSPHRRRVAPGGCEENPKGPARVERTKPR